MNNFQRNGNEAEHRSAVSFLDVIASYRKKEGRQLIASLQSTMPCKSFENHPLRYHCIQAIEACSDIIFTLQNVIEIKTHLMLYSSDCIMLNKLLEYKSSLNQAIEKAYMYSTGVTNKAVQDIRKGKFSTYFSACLVKLSEFVHITVFLLQKKLSEKSPRFTELLLK